MRDVLVLCYHSISDDWPVPTSVRPRDFADHVRRLRERGYRGVTFSEAATAPPAGRVVAVTFDDAHRSVLEHGVPVLAEAGWPATVFVATDYVARPTVWAGLTQWVGTELAYELDCMTWEELGSLEGWEIGSHTCSHPRLTELDDVSLMRELRASRAEIERRLGRPCDTLAYPYGDWDGRVVAATRDAGYRLAATAPTRGGAAQPLVWPRRVIGRDAIGRKFGFRTSRVVRRVENTPGLGPATEPLRRAASRLARTRAAA